MIADKDKQICKKRLLELANTCYYKGYTTFSDFLNLQEQTIYNSLQSIFPNVHCTLWGGIDTAERKIACFSKEEPDYTQFPITVLQIAVSQRKYAENLSHRDYLGAILHLGLGRSVIGDIMLQEQDAYVCVLSSMAEYICMHLDKIRHTKVKVTQCKPDFTYEQKYKEIFGTVQSIRLDTMVALAFQHSRNQILEYISSGKVFVNGISIYTNAYRLKDNDIVSVRGLGKFMYVGEQDLTKKGKWKVLIKKYI